MTPAIMAARVVAAARDELARVRDLRQRLADAARAAGLNLVAPA
jgi:hypothetical protein